MTSSTESPTAPPRKRTWRRRLIFAGVLGILVCVVVAAGLEIGFRLFWNPDFLAELQQAGMYRNAEPGSVTTVPGYRGTLEVDGRITQVRLNGLGMRGPEIGPRQPDELRMLILGDSVVFGYGVEAEETFAARVAPRMSESLGRPVVSGNAGVPGYGTVEQVRHLRRLLESFDPDYVVSCVYLGNDFLDDQTLEHYVENGVMVPADWGRLFQRSVRARWAFRSRFLLWCELWLMTNAPEWALRPTPLPEEVTAFAGFPSLHGPNRTHAGLFMDIVDESHSWDPAAPVPVVPRVLAKVRASLSELKELAGERPVLVLILPTKWHVDEDLWRSHLEELQLEPERYRFGLARERVQRLCEELDLPVADVLEWLPATDDPGALFIGDGGHFNVRGHEVLAERLAECATNGVRHR